MKENNKTKQVDELVDDWAEQIALDAQNPMTTGFPSIDKDLKNKYRGKVGAVIGYGGSKKSLFALQCLNSVVQSNNLRGIYSTMEMPSTQLLNRILDQSFEVQNCTNNTSDYLEYNFLQDKLKLDAVKNGLKNKYGDRLLINQQSRMTVKDYRRILDEAISKYGSIDALVVDGLSMMGGEGSETVVYTTNSGELKDLAKEYNIYIQLICHLSKGAERHTRDVQRYVRGSEKILDNVDFIVQMSLCQENFDNTQYMKNKGYIRFYNKRGSGNTVSVIYDFDPSKLWMVETLDDPSSYEIVEEKAKKKYGF